MSRLTQDPVMKAQQRAELAELRAREQKAAVSTRIARMQLKALREGQKNIRTGRRGGRGEPMALAEGSSGGGYRSDRWARSRADGNRGGVGSAQSFLSEGSRRRMRIECQRLDRTNPLARGLVSRSCDLTNSNGYSVQANSKDVKWNKAAEEWFNTWARRTGHEAADGQGCDYYGEKALSQYTYQVDHAMHIDADLGVVFTDEGSLQAIEGERIINPGGRGDTDKLVAGIELDAQGRPIRYHVADWAPLGKFVQQSKVYAVDAEHFALLVNPTRARHGARRGEPTMAAVIERFENLDDTSEAVRMAYFVAACQAMIASNTNPGIQQGLAPGETVTNDLGSTERHQYVDPGTINHVAPGTELTAFKPEQPSTHYDVLRMAEITDIAADAGLPVVLLLLDFRQVNYSSARSAVITAFRMIRRRQQYIIDAFLCRVWRWRIAMAIRRGEITGFPAGYAPEGWDRHEWTPPPPPVLDVKVEMEAAEIADRAGLKSLKRIMQDYGVDYDSETERMAFEREDRAAKGILPVADPGSVDPNASAEDGDEDGGTNAEDAEGAEGAEKTGADGTKAPGVKKTGTKKKGAAGGGGANVQATALNGAQVASLLLIGDKIADGSFSVAAAEAAVRISYPTTPDELITAYVSNIEPGSAKPEPPTEPASPAEPAPIP